MNGEYYDDNDIVCISCSITQKNKGVDYCERFVDESNAMNLYRCRFCCHLVFLMLVLHTDFTQF